MDDLIQREINTPIAMMVNLRMEFNLKINTQLVFILHTLMNSIIN